MRQVAGLAGRMMHEGMKGRRFLRHLALDLHVGIQLAPARSSAAVLLVLSVVLAVAIAVRLW